MSKELDQGKHPRFTKAMSRILDRVYEFFSGAALSWTSVPYLMLRRNENEKLFVLALLLNLHGLSPLPPLYRLWLLPEVTPQIMYWRRKLLLWDDDLEMADLKHIGH